jgi:hypothetical protein
VKREIEMEDEVFMRLKSSCYIHAEPNDINFMKKYKEYFDKCFRPNESNESTEPTEPTEPTLNYEPWINKMNLLFEKHRIKLLQEIPTMPRKKLELISFDDPRIIEKNKLVEKNRPRCYFLIFYNDIYKYLGIIDWTNLKNVDFIMEFKNNKSPADPLTQDELFEKIVDNLSRGISSHFDDEQFNTIDKYVDEEISQGNIVKMDMFDFRCNGWVKKINDALAKKPDNQTKLEAVTPYDSRIEVRIKGQRSLFYSLPSGSIY